MTVTLVIPGKPYGKKRARATAFRGRARMYDPKENISFERTVAAIAAPLFPQPFEGPIKITIRATFVPPQSWSKRKVEAHIHRAHTQRPDLDNVAKGICDGLNRIAWADDAQVAELTVSKVWGLVEQTVVFVEAAS